MLFPSCHNFFKNKYGGLNFLHANKQIYSERRGGGATSGEKFCTLQ